MTLKGRVTKEKTIERHLHELLEEEISEAGSRLVKALAAEEEGHAEAAEVLRKVALGEARHAWLIAKALPENPFGNPTQNLQSSIEGDADAARREDRYARLATELGRTELARLLKGLSADELKHVESLRKVVKRK